MTDSDWYPPGRDAQLAMVKNWVGILTARGEEWKVPAATVQNLSAVAVEADSVLAAAKSEVSRTPVVTAHCREVFGHMEDLARDIKKRYFYAPPLVDADFVALGLKIPDPVHSPTGKPTAHVTVETFLVGRHELGARLIYVDGSPEDKENKGYRIWYKVIGPGEEAPGSPKQLTESFYTRRRKDVIEFEYEDSGKTAYMAVQIENDGKKGPWGPLVNALIP